MDHSAKPTVWSVNVGRGAHHTNSQERGSVFDTIKTEMDYCVSVPSTRGGGAPCRSQERRYRRAGASGARPAATASARYPARAAVRKSSAKCLPSSNQSFSTISCSNKSVSVWRELCQISSAKQLAFDARPAATTSAKYPAPAHTRSQVRISYTLVRSKKTF